MTYEQFKYCCLVFCKYFEGNTFDKIVEPNGVWNNGKNIIDVTNTCFLYGYCFSTINPEENVLFYFGENCFKLNINNGVEYPLFKTIKDFLKHFEICLKDIV